MNVGVIGAGGWGTTVAELLGKKGFTVTLWVHGERTFSALKKWNENIFYLKGIKLTHIAKYTMDINEAVRQKELVVLAVPAQKLRKVIEEVPYPKDSIIVNLAKGIENGTNKRMSEVIREVWNDVPLDNIATISGPNFAIEIAREMPAATVVGGISEPYLKEIQKTFMTKYFRVYYTTDIVGVELGGSLKNVLAVGAGISDGLGFGDSSKSSLIVRGIRELIRFGTKLGGREKTFYGLSGIGDLIATSFSKKSRNRWAGEEIGKGRSKEEIEEMTKQAIEGIYTVKSIYEMKNKFDVEMPITEAIYNIIYRGKSPKYELGRLMERPPKKEIL